MRKLFVLLVSFLSFGYVTLAKNNDIKVSFDKNKSSTSIRIKKGKIVKIPIYYNSSDEFTLYTVDAKLNYDNSHLKLLKDDFETFDGFQINVEEDNIFSAYRISETKNSINIIGYLKFKVIKSGKTKISLEDVNVSNLVKTKKVNDSVATLSRINRNTKIVYAISGIIIIGCAITIGIRKKRGKK